MGVTLGTLKAEKSSSGKMHAITESLPGDDKHH